MQKLVIRQGANGGSQAKANGNGRTADGVAVVKNEIAAAFDVPATTEAAEPQRPASPSIPASMALPGAAESGLDEERIPLRGLRRRIAENMVLSTSTIPQVTAMIEVDATELVALRKSILAEAERQGVKLSYLPFIIKALIHALGLYPYVNSTIEGEQIVLKHTYHIGIATATPDGLLVPVLRYADRLTVLEIAREVNRLAEAGRDRKLQLQELRGSSFTISNYGTVGGFFTTPIINPGEAGILGLGRIVKRPWVVDDRVEVRPVLPLSFTADHRLIDGELAMRFMNTLVASLENPNLLLLNMR
ncbi:MAG: 2-oxo acid dehydrogenase subunit E2 [Ktedonobacteraceae bacterium]|nr:2-oxo acid dehydrogenase subunit E2 [Ktedonobacteraceae bacterium]